jgi:hypothetical protein
VAMGNYFASLLDQELLKESDTSMTDWDILAATTIIF